MDFKYWDEYGEGITEEEAFEAYDDMLDGLYDEVFGILPSTILKECDPIAYRVGFNDFEDSQLEDGSWVDEDPNEDLAECEECLVDLKDNEIYTRDPRILCEDCAESLEEDSED